MLMLVVNKAYDINLRIRLEGFLMLTSKNNKSSCNLLPLITLIKVFFINNLKFKKPKNRKY